MVRAEIKYLCHFLITAVPVWVPEAAHLHANAQPGVDVSPRLSCLFLMTNSSVVSVGGGRTLQRGYLCAQQPADPRKGLTAQSHGRFGGEEQLCQLQAAELKHTEAAGFQQGSWGLPCRRERSTSSAPARWGPSMHVPCAQCPTAALPAPHSGQSTGLSHFPPGQDSPRSSARSHTPTAAGTRTGLSWISQTLRAAETPGQLVRTSPLFSAGVQLNQGRAHSTRQLAQPAERPVQAGANPRPAQRQQQLLPLVREGKALLLAGELQQSSLCTAADEQQQQQGLTWTCWEGRVCSSAPGVSPARQG